MKTVSVIFVVTTLCAPAMVFGAEASFAQKPAVAKAGDGAKIDFAVAAATDVEVSILGADGKVVRHLAAGVLGGPAAPPAPLKAGLSQSLEWDGRDDFGEAGKGGPFSVRVRAGTGVKLEKIVGGDPYAFYSKEMGQGDHAAWRLTGLEIKSDGKVYVMGNADNYGPPAIRQYAADGSYLRTVYPPPAGMKPEEVKGWGIIEKPDGTYTFQYSDLHSPALSKTIIAGTRGHIAELVPSPGKGELLLEDGYRLMKVNVDGSVPASPMLSDQLVNDPPIGGKSGVVGPMQVAVAPDGKHFYLGGVFAASGGGRGRTGAEKTGPWRDGQIYKVDCATRKATVFFALPEKDVITDLDARGKSPIADFKYGTYAALQGVAVDAEGHVFVCDRQNKRVLVLDASAKILREIPLEHPDAIAVHPKSKALYVTTRTGHYHGRGTLKLHRFSDWSKDTAPAQTLELCPVCHFDQATHLAVAEAGKEVYVWVAYTALPVRVYRDTGTALELAKDFYEAGTQRALDLQHFAVDPATESVYIADGFNNCFRITDWEKPEFTSCMIDKDTKLRAMSLSVDSRNRFLYGHQDRRPVVRYRLDGEFLTQDIPGGQTPAAPDGDGKGKREVQGGLTPQITNAWAIGLGQSDRGIAAAPDGSVVTMNRHGTGPQYGSHLRFYRADPAKAPWGEGLQFQYVGENSSSAGVRFDPRGNLYVGRIGQGKEKASICRFAPTGKLGDLFPTEPAAPAKIYDVNYGYPNPGACRTPRFGVDGWGRVWYPDSLAPRVAAIDNEGNEVLGFGTYGNRDSMGGLAGDLVPTKDVPLALPNCVDATDDYVYVGDIVNIRLLRLRKTFAAAETCGVK